MMELMKKPLTLRSFPLTCRQKKYIMIGLSNGFTKGGCVK